jgi:AbrB family looped-hinge helix DNA binding protein
MEKRAKVTSKGQITIPQEFRRLLGVKTGDDVVFESTESGVNVRPASQSGSALEKYRGIGNPGLPSGRKAIVKYVRDLRGR